MEKQLSKQIKTAVKEDRKVWLNGILTTGSWEELRRLKKQPRVHSRKFKDATGRLVESTDSQESRYGVGVRGVRTKWDKCKKKERGTSSTVPPPLAAEIHIVKA